MTIDFVDLDAKDPLRERSYSEKLACPNGHDIAIEELEPRQFSFNGPWGACPVCSGLGTRMEVDPELVVPDDDKTLAEGAIAPWASAQVADYFYRLIASLADTSGFRTEVPWHSLPAAAKKLLLYGVPGQVHVRYRNRYGRERSYNAKYEGVVSYIERRHAEAETDTSRERFAGYMREVPCTACHGARLKPTSLAVTIGGKNIAEVADMSIDGAAGFLGGLTLTDRERQIAERVLKEINERLRFLLDVGLDYLSLSRPTGQPVRR